MANNSGKKLLIVIDLQNGWRHKTASEPAMLQTVELCKKFKGDVVHCCFRNDPSTLFYKQLNWTRFSDSPDIDEIPEIKQLGLPIHWRNTYSCLTEDMVELIKKYDHIYLAGVFTDISVATTAMNLFDRGINVSVVKDSVATLHGQDVHNQYLKSLEHALGNHNLVSYRDLIN